MAQEQVTIVVDALGGDYAPSVVLAGCEKALSADPDLQLILTGPAEEVEPFAANHARAVACPTTEFIAMDEHPANAVRKKKDSSIVVGCRLVKEGKAQGFFSAGSTGACMSAATLVMGRIKGVSRPAIASYLPSPKGDVIMLDSGANADCKPEYLLQFGQMGVAYAKHVLGVEAPKAGLLNIGSEDTKGSTLAQESFALLQERLPEFAGNCEGNDIMQAHFDVVIADGFTGNVALKTIEGTAKVLLYTVKDILTSSATHKIAGAILSSSMKDLKKQMSSESIGGAPLLGVKGACVIGHGSSNDTAIMNGINQAATAARAHLDQIITEIVQG